MDAGDAPRGKFAGKPAGKFAGKSFGDKPAGRTFGDKPAGDKRFGERPPRRDGDAPVRARGERRAETPGFDKPRAPRVEKPRRVLREPQSEPSAFEGERIAKVKARVGMCSRRDAEAWIEAGRVSVNGEVLTSAAVNVTQEDRVTIDGKPLAARERTRLFMFHKPRGLVTTDYDPEGRPTIFDALPENLPRLVSIGRLDINTEGLLLLTNDGGLAPMARPTRPSSTHFATASRSTASNMPGSRRISIANRAPIAGSRWVCAKARTARSSACSSISGWP